MDQFAYPFNPLPDEERFHLFHNIHAKIEANDTDIKLEPIAGSILITNERVAWFTTPRDLTEDEKGFIQTFDNQHGQQEKSFTVLNHKGKSFMFKYNDLVSHGLQGQKLFCFLGSAEEMELEGIQQQSIQEITQQQDPADIVQVEGGTYKIEFDLKELPKEEQENLFQVLSEYAAFDEDDLEEGMDQMITADQIDDDGNIKMQQEENGQDENDDSWEDDNENGKML
ncbi:hypothetical protein pb186bvf_008605 [Paramecium bursaria]